MIYKQLIGMGIWTIVLPVNEVNSNIDIFSSIMYRKINIHIE